MTRFTHLQLPARCVFLDLSTVFCKNMATWAIDDQPVCQEHRQEIANMNSDNADLFLPVLLSPDRRNAIVTVDIVVFCGDEIPLIRRKKDPFAGQWALPGGHLEEEDENLEAAIMRETREETGIINLKNLTEIGTYSNKGRDPRYTKQHCISVLYTALVDVKTTITQVEDKGVVEICWFPIDNLPDPLAFDHRKMIEDTLYSFYV